MLSEIWIWSLKKEEIINLKPRCSVAARASHMILDRSWTGCKLGLETVGVSSRCYYILSGSALRLPCLMLTSGRSPLLTAQAGAAGPCEGHHNSLKCSMSGWKVFFLLFNCRNICYEVSICFRNFFFWISSKQRFGSSSDNNSWQMMDDWQMMDHPSSVNCSGASSVNIIGNPGFPIMLMFLFMKAQPKSLMRIFNFSNQVKILLQFATRYGPEVPKFVFISVRFETHRHAPSIPQFITFSVGSPPT